MMTLTLSQLATRVGLALNEQKIIICTAESCTGGGLSYWITSVAGSSQWFDRGFIVYTNQAKIDLLAVNASTIEQYGAVSEQTAREMAEGALKNSLANISIAITGIAGPTGESPSKPVGTTWVAFARNNHPTLIMKYLFQGDRQQIRNNIIATVFQQLLNII